MHTCGGGDKNNFPFYINKIGTLKNANDVHRHRVYALADGTNNGCAVTLELS